MTSVREKHKIFKFDDGLEKIHEEEDSKSNLSSSMEENARHRNMTNIPKDRDILVTSTSNKSGKSYLGE